MTNRFARAAAPGAIVLAAAIAAVSCTDINTSADHVASLSFDSLPYPSVVTGDTLRDSLGVAAPLRAIAFNASGTAIANASIQYIALDTGITIGAGGFVTAQGRSGSVRLVATTGSLQTSPTARVLYIARRPDSTLVSGAARDTVVYNLPDNAATNVSPALTVKVATTDTVGGVTGTQGWLVSYAVTYHGATIARGDTATVYLLGDGTQRSQVDTTAGDGTASRRLRINPAGIAPGLDSAIVTAVVRYRGAAVRGSPLRFVILFKAKGVAGS